MFHRIYRSRLSAPLVTTRRRLSSKSSAYIIPIAHESTIPSGSTSWAIDAQRLWSSVPSPSKPPKVGTTHIFYDTPVGQVSAVASLGQKFSAKKADEPERRELVRKAVGCAVKKLKGVGDGIRDVAVDSSLDPHASAVASNLALYKFTLQTSEPSPYHPNLSEPVLNSLNLRPLKESEDWDRGVTYADAQNFARTLTELPANIMTPTMFAERIKTEFDGLANVDIKIHEEAWAEEKGMRTFLSVAKGTSEPPKFLEIHYSGGEKSDKPIVFVGKGVTFDSGGISIKPSSGMKLMRGDMGGAASVCAAALGIARLKLPVNLIVITPLTENMPGPSANKPGDVIYAMNGKSIEIEDTDAEGRLILSDALYYASTTFKPHTLIDVATLTGGIMISLGEVFSGVFATSNSLWEELRLAGETEYDRFWRQPLDDEFGHQIHKSNADLCNYGGRSGSSCTAALFLKAFVDGLEAESGQEAPLKWAHIDIAGTMEATRASPYQEIGMTGRPTRALIEFVRRSIKT